MAAVENQDEDFDEQTEKVRLKERVMSIIGRLDREATQRVGKRDIIEKRWLEDLAQYHGRYDEKLVKDLKEAAKSTLYINSTRPKTNAMASRLSDMLFPTDDRNWGIQPTPVPELSLEAENSAKAEAEAMVALAAMPQDPQRQAMAAAATERAALVQANMDEANKRAEAMEEEIDDHLREANYAAQCRKVIEDGCRLGTGVMKGPVRGDRSRRSWQLQAIDESEDQAYLLTDVEDPRLAFWRVDPWNWFPDMDACEIEDGEGNFERHLLNRKQLRRLARQPGFDKAAIRRLLLADPREAIPSYLSDLRSITGAYQDTSSERYHVWEYHGPLSVEDMQDIAIMLASDSIEDLKDIEIDPLQEMEAVVWFCQGEVIKFGLHFLDSGETIYSVFNLEKDDASVFGFGVPYIMRDPQKGMASAWRTLFDNAGLSSGPQIVVNEQVIEPQNGNWVLEPRKIWLKKKTAPKGEKAFETYNIDSHMTELVELIELCRRNVDEETALPIIAQGEQGSHVTKTAHGMSILMNSVNVVFRRIVKNWDDDMTTPNIRRTYDWLMQFSKKEHIKGDYEVDARGTSVLLVREMQSANLLLFLSNFSGHPILGRFLKEDGLPALRALAKTMMMPADQIIKSNEEVAQDEAAAAQQPPVPDPEMAKITAQLNLETMRGENDLQIEGMKRETALMQLAAQNNMKLEELRTMLYDKDADRKSKERIFAAEAAMTKVQGKGGGGYL